MQAAIGISGAALISAASLAAYLATRREKTELHWLLLALLGALMCWTAGTFVRFSVSSADGLQAALRLIFLGLFATPPLFLLVAARHTGAGGWLARHSSWVLLSAPSVGAYLALLTNGAHQLVMREVSFAAMEAGGRAWGGPVFWAFIAWAYLLTTAGGLLYLRAARRMALGIDRRRGILLVTAALLPLASAALYLFQLVPLRFDLTPAALIGSMLLISVAVFRYQLLESLPLARRDVIEQLPDAVVIANAGGVILDVNPAAAALLRLPPETMRARLLGPAMADLFAASERQRVLDAVAALLPSDAPTVFEAETADGRCLELSLACVGGGDERAGAFAVLRDRTQQRRFERDARQSQKLETVGTLISGVAHEVNNPLAFIRANLSEIHRMGELVETVRDDGANPKLAEELADLCGIAEETLDGIARIERIVTDMRRLGSPRDRRLTQVDVNDVARDALRLSNLSREEGVELHTRFAEGLPPVEGAAPTLVQAVLNLLVNARHALSGAGRLWLETGVSGEHVEIVVRDDGPGVPEAVRERIFDAFFTMKEPDEGTGLGLTIALDIARDHRGALEHRQPADGGCSFALRLPVRA